MKFTDSHCHLDFEEFDQNRDEIIKTCQLLNVHRIVIPAIAPNNWQKVLQLCDPSLHKGINLHPCLGIHPWFLKLLTDSDLESLSTLVSQNKGTLCAIGEAGIDGKIAIEQNNLNQQITFFDFQLNLAVIHSLPIIVHHRRSHNEVIERIKLTQPAKSGIIHAFSGSYQQAKTYVDLGFKLGIGGTITYPRAKKTINTIKQLPLESLVLETDAPAMPLYAQQGQANSPINLVPIFNSLCSIRSESTETIAAAIEENIQQIFSFDKP